MRKKRNYPNREVVPYRECLGCTIQIGSAIVRALFAKKFEGQRFFIFSSCSAASARISFSRA